MDFLEAVRMAYRSVRANLTRSLITLMIIALGITALVGILTAIDTLIFSLTDSISSLGANSFSIVPSGNSARGNRDGKQQKRGDVISFDQAMKFKERYDFSGAKVTISTRPTGSATLKYKDEKSNPNVRVYGIDENQFDVWDYEIDYGRNFSFTELESGAHKTIVGYDIVNLFFDAKAEKAIDKIISINNVKYKIIGTVKSKGSSMSSSADRRAYIPLNNERRYYGYANKNYNVSASIAQVTKMDEAISSAIGVLRPIRRLRASQQNDFEIRSSNGLLDFIKENTLTIRIATIAIGLITLLGAAIGLMNIMLVTVTERTKEIGISKALGATRSNILTQFLTEAVIICQLGGIVGVIFGIIVGLIVALAIGGSFVMPWAWIILGIFTCTVVGLISGLYPALKAARLDPIESLRYE